MWRKSNPKPWDGKAQREYTKRFEGYRQKWLDEGRGSCALCDPALRAVVAEGFHHFDSARYILGDYVIMPNHVHILVTPMVDWELTRILHTWKSYSGHEILRRTGGDPPFWLQEIFDHAVRSPKQLTHFRNYIRENPEKAKLRSGSYTHLESPPER